MSICPKPGHSLIKATSSVQSYSDAESDYDANHNAVTKQHQTSPGPSQFRIASMSLIGTIPYGGQRSSRQQEVLPHNETLKGPLDLCTIGNMRLKRKFGHDHGKGKPKPFRRTRTRRLAEDDDVDHSLTLTEQISTAGEFVALAAHVEDMETMGRGANGRMPTVDILGSARQLLGYTRRDAPGLPGTGYSAFVLCGVVHVVERIMVEDAVDPEDVWYGAKDLSLDLEDSEVFVSEDVVVARGLESFELRATSAEKPESPLLDWPGWFEDEDIDELDGN